MSNVRGRVYVAHKFVCARVYIYGWKWLCVFVNCELCFFCLLNSLDEEEGEEVLHALTFIHSSDFFFSLLLLLLKPNVSNPRFHLRIRSLVS